MGWLLRGGITIGELFVDNVMVWGNTLLRAYELEDKIVIYPRVIIDDKVVEYIHQGDSAYDFIRYDKDGFDFVNYLTNFHFVGRMLMEEFEIMKSEAGPSPNDKVRQKLIWHKNFVNNELDIKNEKSKKKFRLHYGK